MKELSFLEVLHKKKIMHFKFHTQSGCLQFLQPCVHMQYSSVCLQYFQNSVCHRYMQAMIASYNVKLIPFSLQNVIILCCFSTFLILMFLLSNIMLATIKVVVYSYINTVIVIIICKLNSLVCILEETVNILLEFSHGCVIQYKLLLVLVVNIYTCVTWT